MSETYLDKTAQEWHDIALEWKRLALNAEIRVATAERDANLLADRLIEESEGFQFQTESVMDDLATMARPPSADGPFRD